jgi:hypothetical protein
MTARAIATAGPVADSECYPPDMDAVDSVLDDPKVRLAMRARCEQQGHQWEPLTIWRGGFPGPTQRHSYSVCAWCGERQ